MPDLNSLYTEIKASFASTYNQNVSPLPKSFLNILAKVLAGLMNAVYKYGNFTSKQIFLKTASFASITLDDGTVIRPLVEAAGKYGIGEPTPATQAELETQATVIAAGTIPSGTQLTNKATGVIYTTTQDYTVTSGTVNLSILASGDATNTGGFGVIGNMEIGDIVTFINPQSTAAEASIVTILTTAADAETEDNYRNKATTKAKQQTLPNNLLWYREEAAQIGTVRVYPYKSSNAGFIDIYVKSTLAGSVIPTQTQLDEVLNAVVYDVTGIIQLPATLKPKNINVLPVTTKTFSITISTINSNNELASIQTAITSALQDLFANYEPYISAIDVTDARKDLIDLQEINGLVYSTAKARGATIGGVTLFKSGSSITKYLLDKDELATLASVDYV